MGANKYTASGKTDYETPQDLFDMWNEIFEFNLDAAANESNYKFPLYIDSRRDAFRVKWNFNRLCEGKETVVKGRVWLNPPYGAGIDKWIQRAIDQVKEGYAEFVVMLLPANTDTKWFHTLCKKHGKILFLHTGNMGRSRIKFVGEKWGMMNGSMLVLFGEDPSGWEWDMEGR